MASGGIIKFLVDITSKGGARVKSDMNDVSKATNRAGDAHVSAEKAAHQYFDTQAKGVIGTANSTKSFSKLAQTMNSGGGVVGAYATLAANVFALTAAFNALKSAAAMQQIERGLEALGARTGQTLTVAADGLREITGMAISSEQALRSSAQVFSAGFNADQLERLGKVATDTSFALGRNMTDSMDRLVRGVIKLEPELLDELGIMTRLGDATKAYAAELGKSEATLTTTERRQAFFNAAMAEGELKFGGLADQAGNTKAFDQLSASLADMTKQTLNFLNVAALPLAAIFSTSPLALAGGAILFAATIKNQLLPGLTDLTKRATKAAEELEKVSKKEINDILTIENNPAVLEKLQNKIRDNTASLKDYRLAQADVSKEILRYQSLVDKYEGRSRNTKAQTEEYKKNKVAIIDLKDSYRELNDVIFASERVTTRRNAAASIELAGNFKFRDSLEALQASASGYRKELIAGQKVQQVTPTLMTQIRTTSFAASIGVRAVGAAMLNAIPIIGQVVFVVGLLVAAYKNLQSAEAKALTSATKAFNEIAKSLDDKLQDLERISKSTASTGSRAEQAILLETNALIELAEAYAKVQQARSAYNNDSSQDNKKGFWDSSINELISGVSDASDASKAFRLSVMENIFWINEQTVADRQMFANLAKTAPAALNEIIALHGGVEAFAKLDIKTRRKVLEDLANELGGGARKLRDATTALVEAQKAVGTSTRDFLKSVIPTTPFDEVASDLKEYNKSIADFNSLVIAGEAKAEDLNNILSSMPETLSGLLSLNSAQFLEDTNLVNNVKQAGEAATETEIVLAAAAKERLDLKRSSFEQVQAETIALEAQFKLAQASVILAKSENEILNARLKASQNNLNLTTTGLKRKLELENKLIENNVTALRQQKLIVEAQISQQKLRIEEINDQTRLLEIAKDRFELIRQENKERATQRVSAAQETYDNLSRNPSERRAKEVLERAQKDLDRYDEMTEKYLNAYDSAINSNKARVAALRSENRSLQLGIEAVQNEINAALMTQLTTAEQAVLIQQKQAEIDRTRAAQIREMRDVLEELTDIEGKRQSLINKGKISLSTEILAAQSRYRLNRDLLRQESAERIQQLELERAKSDADRRDSASRTAALQHWNEELRIARVREQVDIARLDANYELEQLQRAIFDVGKEGLEWQRDSLALYERQITAAQDLSNATVKTAQSFESLYRKRMGFGEITQAGEDAQQIRAARIAYEQAVKESEVKKALIDLEFALLEAQQLQLQEELRARKAVLESQNSTGVLSPQIRQLESVLTNMPRINYEAMRSASKAIIDEGIIQARNALDEARTPSSGRINSAAYDTRRLREERSLAASVLNGAVQPIAVSAISEAANSLESSVTEPLVASQSQLNTSLQELRGSVEALRSTLSPASPTATPQYSAREIAAAMGKYINEQLSGMTAWQQPDIGNGRVGQHSPGSAHYSGRAIDVYSRAGNGEWTDPAERARYESLKTLIKSIGGNVLFGQRDNHLDHLHASFSEGSINMVKAVELLGSYLPERVGRAIAEQLPTVLEDVIVTAERTPSEIITPPQARGPLQETNLAVPAMYSNLDNVVESMVRLKDHASQLRAIFEDLGPNGQTMIAVMNGVDQLGSSLQTAIEVLKRDSTPTERFQAMASVAMASVTSIQAIMQSASAARIAMIDQEIAAEQKRDGKSAESVAKIASLEKKKDAMQKKAFETNKKLQMAQAIISTASAVAQTYAMGGPLAIPLAAMIGALGAAQLAIIAGTSYQSTSAASSQASTTAPSTLSIGKRDSTVDLAKNNPNAGGEIGYIRGTRGYGNNAANYSVIGSAYGGPVPRGYGKTAFLVGEHGPEVISPEVPMAVKPSNDNIASPAPVPVTFQINTIDASGVEEVLRGQRGTIIGMLREAANANGQTFLEDVNIGVYTKPNVGRL